MIEIQVRYFAVLRDRRGLASETIKTGATTTGQLVKQLTVEHQLGLPEALIRVAKGSEFVEHDCEIQDGDQLVLIPPVAGG